MRRSEDLRRWEMKTSSKMSLKCPFPLGERVSLREGEPGERAMCGEMFAGQAQDSKANELYFSNYQHEENMNQWKGEMLLVKKG